MGVPGSNLLKQAFTHIVPTDFTYYKALSREENSVGEFVTTFAAPVLLQGSWQPVPRAMYPDLGLSLTEDYWVLYVSEGMIDVQRDVPPDQVIVNGSLYQCESAVPDWFSIDGWLGMLCILIQGPADKSKNASKRKIGNFSLMLDGYE